MYILLALAVSSFLLRYHGQHIIIFFPYASVGFFSQSIYIQTSLHLRIPRSKHSVFRTIHRYLFQLVSVLFLYTYPILVHCPGQQFIQLRQPRFILLSLYFIYFASAFLIHLKSWPSPMTSRLSRCGRAIYRLLGSISQWWLSKRSYYYCLWVSKRQSFKMHFFKRLPQQISWSFLGYMAYTSSNHKSPKKIEKFRCACLTILLML